MASTRLNKTMIDQIVANVINDTTIPREIDALKDELRTRGTQLAREATPPELLAISKKHPREWFHWKTSIHVSGQGDDKHPLAGLGFTYYENIEIEPTPLVAQYGRIEVPLHNFDDLRVRAEEIAARQDKIKEELRAYLYSRRTVEAAVKDMPELEPHMPVKPTTGGALVAASNVLSVLSASGFSVSKGSQKT